MKSFLLFSLLIAACAQAQTPARAAAPPKQATLVAPAEEIKLDTVVARMATKAFTVAGIKALADKLPADAQRSFLENPKAALQALSLMEYLSQEADKAKLAEVSPYKEQLAMQRAQMMAQAMVAYHSQAIEVPEEDVRKKFDADPKLYEQAKLRVITLTYADPKVSPEKLDPKPLTEEQAMAKALDLVERARAGADFAELAKTNSHDRSAPKGGEFGAFRRTDRIPEAIQKAVFALKPGEVTEPVKEGPMIWVIKVDEYLPSKFEEVRPQILFAMKTERHQQWLKDLQKQFEVTIEKPEFFKPPEAPQAPAPAPAAATEKK